MKAFDHLLLFVGWLVVMWYALHILPVTGLVYQPEEVDINGTKVTLVRSFPMDQNTNWRPSLSYQETVQPLTPLHNGGQVCEDQGGPFPYERSSAVGTWDIRSWAAPCLDDPLGYVWTARWYWHTGNMKLGPVTLSQRFILPTEQESEIRLNQTASEARYVRNR